MLKEANSKKTTKTLEYLNEIIGILEYYMKDIPKDIQKKLINIEETIHDLSIDRDQYNKRLIPRLKERWRKEHVDND